MSSARNVFVPCSMMCKSLRGCGANSTCSIFQHLKNLSSSTWNTRSLLHHKTSTKSRKINVLNPLVRNNDTVNLQEVRGSKQMIHIGLQHLRHEFAVYHSCS
eukprot:10242634-Karenia_brevis.AAC.1